MSRFDILEEGSRVLVFDSRLFKDDTLTPSSVTMKPATIVRRYGTKLTFLGITHNYDDMVDVIFDHRPGVESKRHFSYGVILIDN